MVKDVTMEDLDAKQDWLNRRFQGLTPEDFGDVHFISPAPLNPPPGFEGVWRTDIREGDKQELLKIEAIVCLCDTSCQSQVEKLCQYIQVIVGIGHDAPTIICAPHTRGDRTTVQAADQCVQAHAMHSQLFELGLDGMLASESEGFRWVFELQAKLKKAANLAQTLNDIENERAMRKRYVNHLRECISHIIWDDFRERIAPSIPPRDPEIPHNVNCIDNWQFGSDLGHGMFGSVCEIHSTSARYQGQPKQVMKVVSKQGMDDIKELKLIRRQIEVLNLVSSDEWAHPNVVRFFQCYHSNTHLFFRMESGGEENLYRRLHHRQKKGDAHRPLFVDRCFDLVSQVVAAIAHLHTGPRVCHRDIKPENVIVSDVEGKPLQAKIVDFDLSHVEVDGATCQSSCGTIPFVAPEVFLKHGYSGVTADVWSLGILIIEILCGLRVVEQQVGIEPAGRVGKPAPHVGDKLRAAFSEPGSAGAMVESRHRPELLPLRKAAMLLVDNMVHVDTKLRWTSQQASDALSEFTIFTN